MEIDELERFSCHIEYVNQHLYEMKVLKFLDDESKGAYIHAALNNICTNLQNKFRGADALATTGWRWADPKPSIIISIYKGEDSNGLGAFVYEVHFNLSQLRRDYKINKLFE